MFCERYQEELIELAASSAEPAAALRTHLDACPSCRAALAGERALFAIIDSGLRTDANAPVPASLRARVCAQLDETPEPRRVLTFGWAFAAAAFAAIALASLSVRPHKQPVLSIPDLSVSRGSSAEPAISSPAPFVHVPRTASPAHSRRLLVAKVAPREPEVLVSTEEARGMAQYAAAAQRHRRLAFGDVEDDASTEIKPIVIAELYVKALAESDDGEGPRN
jgi:hypothetical protein